MNGRCLRIHVILIKGLAVPMIVSDVLGTDPVFQYFTLIIEYSNLNESFSRGFYN